MTVVVLSPARPGRYDVRLGEEVIVRGSRDPEHDAARALLARDEGFKVRRWEAFPRERVDARTRFSKLEAVG
jgi:hypothetical protein